MFEQFKVPKNLIPSDPRFGAGPSLVPVGHLEMLAATKHQLLGTSHRQAAVKKLVREVQEGLKQYFSLPEDYQIVVGNGGATFLFDMIGLGLVEKSSVHYTCGEFSTKWYKSHHHIPDVEASNKSVGFGEGINPEHEDGFDMTCGTLNETSTGVMLTELPQKKQGVLTAIDATSGAGQIKIDFNKVDLYFFSPQKVFASEGGLFVAIMSPEAMQRARRLASEKRRYTPIIMDWNLAIDNSLKNQTYNTPSITSFFLLNEQLKIMNQLGEKKVTEMAQKKAQFIYQWAESKEYLNPFVKESRFRSQAVATIDVHEAYSADDLAKVLREQNIAWDIDAYRKLGRNQFRFSLFHNVLYEDIEKLTKIISMAIEQHL